MARFYLGITAAFLTSRCFWGLWTILVAVLAIDPILVHGALLLRTNEIDRLMGWEVGNPLKNTPTLSLVYGVAAALGSALFPAACMVSPWRPGRRRGGGARFGQKESGLTGGVLTGKGHPVLGQTDGIATPAPTGSPASEELVKPGAFSEKPGTGPGSQALRASERGLNGPHILLMGSDYDHRIMCLTMLETLKCQATVASCTAEALQKLARQKYDLVLLDAQMHWEEFAARLRAAEGEAPTAAKTGGVPVIVLGVHDFLRSDYLSWATAGVNGWLNKPFTLGALAGELQNWLPGRLPHAGAPSDSLVSREYPAAQAEPRLPLEDRYWTASAT